MADIQQLIERSFYEAIRIKLVADGWTPDITNLTDFPDSEAGYTAYRAALKAIATAKGYAVEAFGSANPQDRAYKDLPRIVLQTSSFMPGDVGYDSSPKYILNTETNKYELFSYDSRTYVLFMDCRVVAKTQEQLRIIMDVIHTVLPLMGYLTYYNDAADSFFVESSSFQPLISSDDGILEYNYRYEVPDIQWRNQVEVVTDPAEGIAKISQITINMEIADWLGISAYQSGVSEIIT